MRRHTDPLHLDVAAFAAAGASLDGQWPAADLPRWHAMQAWPAGAAAEPVQWQLHGELRRAAGQTPQVWLHLRARAVAGLTCQRCLQPFAKPLQVDRWFRFAADEREAEALDADSEDDVLALTSALDARELVEDELLLAVPIVPRHPACALPEHHAGDAAGGPASPFAALAPLRGGAPPAPK